MLPSLARRAEQSAVLVIVDEMHAQYCLAVQMCLAGHYYPCEVAWIHLDSKGGFCTIEFQYFHRWELSNSLA